MVRRIFHDMLLRRHFWRYATFSEVAELYVSRMLRMAALYLVNAFVSVYMYQMGYSLSTIAFVWVIFYIFKVFVTLLLARFIAWIGPKHAILVSNLLYIPAMILFANVDGGGFGLLIPALLLQGLSSSLYAVAYSIDFSKVKNVQHAGKEIAYMNIFEKVTTGLSPVVGGFLAYWFGPHVIILLAAVLFAFAAMPLLKTGEQVRRNQRLKFVGFPWRLLFRHATAQFAYGFDVFVSGTAWSLYVAVFIIGMSSGNKVYATTGLLTSVVLVVAIFASYTYGKIIDRNKGKQLMNAATVMNAITHLVRPFIQTTVPVAGLNAANELATTGYLLPYTRAVFDNADISGARVTYLGFTEVIANIGAALGAVILGFLLLVFESQTAFQAFFFVGAAVSLLILTARFPLYKK